MPHEADGSEGNSSTTGALFSPNRTYRHALWRVWDGHTPTFVVIGLNPLTAHGIQDGPTMRRCIHFAKREGCGR